MPVAKPFDPTFVDSWIDYHKDHADYPLCSYHGTCDMIRVVRETHLTPDEVAKYERIRKQVEGELPELIARHHKRTRRTPKPDCVHCGIAQRLGTVVSCQCMYEADL